MPRGRLPLRALSARRGSRSKPWFRSPTGPSIRADKFPAAQWDYQLFYRENFDAAVAGFERDVGRTVRALFRAGDPAGKGKPARTSFIRANGGWFGPGGRPAPDLPRDPAILNEEEERRYVAALERNGFFGPCSWYMNWNANIAYAERAKANWRLNMPVLFLHAAYDYVCETLVSRLAEPMRANCDNLTEAHDRLRPLDGAGKAGRGQRGAGEMARRAVSRAMGRVAHCHANGRHCERRSNPGAVGNAGDHGLLRSLAGT